MENRTFLSDKDLKKFNFNNINKYVIIKASGLIGNKSCIDFYSDTDIYRFVESSNIRYDSWYKYIPILKKFYKKTSRIKGYYDFDRNKNKPYIIDDYKVTIIPEISIEKLNNEK